MKDTKNPTASGKTSPASVTQSKQAVAKTIMDGTVRGLRRIRDASLVNPLKCWITGHVADETKLWYILNDYGYRKFSTLSHHTHVTWSDVAGVHDEHVIRPHQSVAGCTAFGQVLWHHFDLGQS